MKRKPDIRTWEQRWASERCFINKGRLTSVASSIRQVALANSTTPLEYKILMAAHDKVSQVLNNWEKDAVRSRSKLYYKRNL